MRRLLLPIVAATTLAACASVQTPVQKRSSEAQPLESRLAVPLYERNEAGQFLYELKMGWLTGSFLTAPPLGSGGM
ncbi:MAG: lipoprotein [Rhodothermales bacterium]|nr:lipoprotein [Rhodothermales bacterium]